MKKFAYAISLLVLFCIAPAFTAGQQQDVGELKAKLEKKVADMRAAGATEAEIQKFVSEFKHKQAAQMAGDSDGKVDSAVLKAKLDKKVAEMKAAGASDDEIKKFVVEFKTKHAAQSVAGSNGSLDEALLKEKLDRKVADMKAAGASDEEIKQMVKEFKKSVAEKKAQLEKKDKGQP